jgi:hypothetical protein
MRNVFNSELERNLLTNLDVIIRAKNPIAHAYKMMRQVEEQLREEHGQDLPEVRLLFSLKKDADLGRYNIPATNEVNLFFEKKLRF